MEEAHKCVCGSECMCDGVSCTCAVGDGMVCECENCMNARAAAETAMAGETEMVDAPEMVIPIDDGM